MAIKKAKPRKKVYSLGDGNGLSLIIRFLQILLIDLLFASVDGNSQYVA